MVISTRLTRFNSTDVTLSALDETLLTPSPKRQRTHTKDDDSVSVVSSTDSTSISTASQTNNATSAHSSVLYSPYLTLGLITTDVPPVVLTQTTQSTITLPLPHSYQTLSITHALKTLIVSKPLPANYGEITSLEATSKIVVAGTEDGYLTFFKRGEITTHVSQA